MKSAEIETSKVSQPPQYTERSSVKHTSLSRAPNVSPPTIRRRRQRRRKVRASAAGVSRARCSPLETSARAPTLSTRPLTLASFSRRQCWQRPSRRPARTVLLHYCLRARARRHFLRCCPAQRRRRPPRYPGRAQLSRPRCSQAVPCRLRTNLGPSARTVAVWARVRARARSGVRLAQKRGRAQTVLPRSLSH